MNKEDVKQMFINFLKRRKCYEQFINNIEIHPYEETIESIDDLMAYVGDDYETLIYYPFRWQETPEGLYFWSYIEERWSNHYYYDLLNSINYE